MMTSTVLPALALDLGHRDRADLGGIADVGAAAGLQIDAGDLHQADPARAGRRLDRHRADKLRLGGEILVADPARGHGVRRGDQRVEAFGDRSLVEARPRNIKVEPAPAVGDLAAGHCPRHDAAQQVQAGMHAHQPMAPLPIDLGNHLATRLGQRRAGVGNMDHLVERIALHRIDDCDRLSGWQAQKAGIARLAAARRIEHRAVEPDPPLVGGNHPRRARTQVAVVTKQKLGHGCLLSLSQAFPEQRGLSL